MFLLGLRGLHGPEAEDNSGLKLWFNTLLMVQGLGFRVSSDG